MNTSEQVLVTLSRHNLIYFVRKDAFEGFQGWALIGPHDDGSLSDSVDYKLTINYIN